MMQLNLFLYNPIKNIILGYVIDVKIPLTKNEESKILLVKPFSEEEEPNKYNNFNQYSCWKININNEKELGLNSDIEIH